MFPLFTVSISMWVVQQPRSSTYVLYKPVSLNVHPSFCMTLFITYSYFDLSFSPGHSSFSFVFKPLLGFYLSLFYLFLQHSHIILLCYLLLKFPRYLSSKTVFLFLVPLFSFPSLHPTKSYFSCYYFIISMRMGSAFSRRSFVKAK